MSSTTPSGEIPGDGGDLVAGFDIRVRVELAEECRYVVARTAKFGGEPFTTDIEVLVADEEIGTVQIGELDLGADPPALVAAERSGSSWVGFGSRIFHETVTLVGEPGDAEVHAGGKRTTHRGLRAATPEFADLEVDVSRGGVRRFIRRDAQQADRRVFSKHDALGSAQHLDAVDVEEGGLKVLQPVVRYTVDGQPNGRFHTLDARGGTETADVRTHTRGGGGKSATTDVETHVWHIVAEFLKITDVLFAHEAAFHHGDRCRLIDEAVFPPLCRDQDFLQFLAESNPYG